MKSVCIVGSHARPWMENAARHGYQVAAVDGFNDWDARFFGTLVPGAEGDVLAGYSALPKDAPLIFTSPVESHPDVVERASKTRLVLNAPARVIAKCREIDVLRNFAGDGISIPDTSNNGGARPGWIIKRRNSAGGLGIRADDGILRDGEYRQQFIKGASVGAIFFSSAGGTKFCGIAAHINNGYKFGGLVYPAVADECHLSAIECFGEKLAGEVGLVGWWGADFILNGSSTYLLEVNPRLTAGMELMARAHEIDVVGSQSAAIKGDKCHFETDQNGAYYGREVVYAGNDVVFKDPEKWFRFGMRDVPAEGTKIAKGAPMTSVYAGGASFDECLKNLGAEKTRIEREIYGE